MTATMMDVLVIQTVVENTPSATPLLIFVMDLAKEETAHRNKWRIFTIPIPI
jgi:hypothetical protein